MFQFKQCIVLMLILQVLLNVTLYSSKFFQCTFTLSCFNVELLVCLLKYKVKIESNSINAANLYVFLLAVVKLYTSFIITSII